MMWEKAKNNWIKEAVSMINCMDPEIGGRFWGLISSLLILSSLSYIIICLVEDVNLFLSKIQIKTESAVLKLYQEKEKT